MLSFARLHLLDLSLGNTDFLGYLRQSWPLRPHQGDGAQLLMTRYPVRLH